MTKMLENMPARDFYGWVNAHQLEIIDVGGQRTHTLSESRQDWRTAHIVSTISNLLRKSPKPIADFLLKWMLPSDRPVRKTNEELLAQARRMYEMYNDG